MSEPFQPWAGLILVRGQLFGPLGSVGVQFALDTGATDTIIRPSILLSIGYNPFVLNNQVQVTMGSGVIFAPEVVVDAMTALGQQRTSIAIIAHALPSSAPVDGLLGLDFLRGFQLTVDFRAGTITLV